jgi:bacteriocin biosynthesis cyclodehydratase domain-containing protein
MAPALRMSAGEVAAVSWGAFGDAVAAELAVRVVDTDDLESDRADAYLLLASRPVPELAARLDHEAFARGVPWVPVVMEHPHLRGGPSVIPGHGACHGCYAARVRQHAPLPAVDEALEDHYRRNPGGEPGGYLRPAVVIASMAATYALERLLREPAEEAGRVRRLDLVNQRTSAGRAVGVHGCPTCGSGRPEELRSYAALAGDLGELLR